MVSPFDRAGGRQAKIEVLKDMALRDPGRARVPLADQTMRELILIFEHRNLPKPPPLSTYTELMAAGRVHPRHGDGPEKGETTWRDERVPTDGLSQSASAARAARVGGPLTMADLERLIWRPTPPVPD